ncbi:hypothetical protein [Rubinisphaera brasiliensis]|uniref:hypothetical protein n=1 Tax=Rubinisphaera brasiliensis TaxID=119 RepID=UPI00059E0190|nr:hypothetical protein [Rubinisphaera brasiliensis]
MRHYTRLLLDDVREVVNGPPIQWNDVCLREPAGSPIAQPEPLVVDCFNRQNEARADFCHDLLAADSKIRLPNDHHSVADSVGCGSFVNTAQSKCKQHEVATR